MFICFSGFDEIESMSGDKMALAEDSMARLKAAVAASKEHKLKIIVEVSIYTHYVVKPHNSAHWFETV